MRRARSPGLPMRGWSLARLAERLAAWQTGKIASPGFHRWAAAFPLTRPFVRRDAQRLHDIVGGFVHSQVLLAVVDLGLLDVLSRGPGRSEALALEAGIAPHRMRMLCQAAASLGLLRRQRDGRYRLGRLGAAVLGVPGLEEMIRHHRLAYRDLADPVGLLKGDVDTELSRFWGYVRGGEPDAVTTESATEYSRLMAVTQRLVAEETLDAVPLRGVRRLLDIGGGTGAFLEAVAERCREPALVLLDLPEVCTEARRRLYAAGLAGRIEVAEGSFRDGPLPGGADAISLIRVLYDHDEKTVRGLLAKVFDALPPGGRVIVSEPMGGGARPSRSGDAYFGFYTLAMTTGQPRAPEEHARLLRDAGFESVRSHPTRRGLITGVMTAFKPSEAGAGPARQL